MHNLFAQKIMKDNIVKDVITALKTKGTPPIKSSLKDWRVEDGLLFFKQSSRAMANHGPGQKGLLVAGNGHIYQEICGRLCDLPTNEGKHTPDGTALIPD